VPVKSKTPAVPRDLTPLGAAMLVLGWVLLVAGGGHLISQLIPFITVAFSSALAGAPEGLALLLLPVAVVATFGIQVYLTKNNSAGPALMNGVVIFGLVLFTLLR
jgi:hypothetical protein